MDEERAARERAARVAERNRRRAAKGQADLGAPAGGVLEPRSAPRRRRRRGDLAGAAPAEAARADPRAGGSPTRRAIFSLATALSRVFGLVRQVVAAYYFGAAGKINAFTVAFQLPNLVRALVADAALSSAFVPVFSDLIEKGERRRAWRVASSLFWLMLLGLTALTALFVLVAPWVIGLFGNPGHDRSLAVGLSQVLFPIVALLGVSGVFVGILNTYDHFTVPALSPVVWNLAIIAGLAIGVPAGALRPTRKLYVYAVSILVATVIQVFLPFPWLRGLEHGEERLRIVLDWRDPMVKRTFVLMVPVTLGLGLINVNAVIDTFFASRLINGNLAPTAIQNAFLDLHASAGDVLGRGRDRALPVALAAGGARRARRLPRDARARAAPDRVPARSRRRPLSAVLAEPIVRLLFQRGAWHP